jgi:hypothetical protein
MNGERVVVKDAEGAPSVVRVCEIDGDIVFVTSERAYERIRIGDNAISPVGFRKECVFEYEGPISGPIKWEKMKRWNPHN